MTTAQTLIFRRCCVRFAVSTVMLLSAIDASASEHLDVPFSLGRGWSTFESKCVECHGAEGGGTEKGPPLIHEYYVPSHHSDAAIERAILHGAKQHHWSFGDMPAIGGISEVEAQQVVAFVRWLQTKKGLLSK
ncbi:MAG: cytochrome c [Proteobacteria bacterium]|nr:MAG: cytochrome c [Pseudomonadota bacterium]